MNTIEPGTVSFGTMRAQDLIPRLFSELARIDLDAYKEVADSVEQETGYFRLVEDASDVWTVLENWNASDSDCENADWILEKLFDALDSLAPIGMYFGSIEGDGADYGFWHTPEGGFLADWECYGAEFDSVSLGADGEEASISQCGGCGSRLGGNRTGAIGVTGDDTFEISVCPDCVQFIANGETPEF